jgi:lipopolysaccharide/colanic/teichoic acid biosynthesis glycosyltransferase/carbonic anhydrase/acetyltransferase-like protein (isoleucine patch superfamily)
MPLPGAAVDLERERSLLWLSERCIGVSEKNGQFAPPADAVIDTTARLIGPVVVQAGARIDAGAQVIGPTVVGPYARIGRDAVVAQCLVVGGAHVPAQALVRHRAVTGLVSTLGPEEDLDITSEIASAPPPGDAPPPRGWYPTVKLAFDVVAAVLGLVVLSPLLALIALVIKLESRGPVLYGDRRETIGGRAFCCWKFRTMYEGADTKQRELLRRNELDGPQFKMDKDPRITPIGHWLRKCSLDELPQLFNVVCGDMSLVGPRPSPFRENQICIPWREGRLSVRAGITGLWQVCREERRAGDFHQWIVYDLLYVQHMSALVDLRILAATVLTGGGVTRVPVKWVIPSAPAQVGTKASSNVAHAVCDSV